jgi:hypothetical protein
LAKRNVDAVASEVHEGQRSLKNFQPHRDSRAGRCADARCGEPNERTSPMERKRDAEADENRDPISGAPGAHPVGVGAGAAGGAAVGAAVGSVGGPVGTAVGAAVGGIAGGLAGKGVAEAINPTVEDEYWRGNYSSRPYVRGGEGYETYAPAYRYGWESYAAYRGRPFDEVEPDLRAEWERSGRSRELTWDRAKEATRDAWHRVERALPGDADRDGR